MFGTNIDTLLTRDSITYKSFAEYCNVSPKTVRLWIKGDTMPNSSQLIAISNFFMVMIDDLLRIDLARYGVPPKDERSALMELTLEFRDQLYAKQREVEILKKQIRNILSD